MTTQGLSSDLVGFSPRNSSVILECLRDMHHLYQLPYCLVAVDLATVGIINASAINDIQEITLLGGCLTRNDTAVYGDRIWLIFLLVSGITYGNTVRGNP